MEQEPDIVEQRLRWMLYRFDCPSALILGEYVLDLLAEPARVDVARHTLDCALCTQDLRETRTSLATVDVLPAPGVWPQLRRVVASLFEPAQPPLAAVRGSEPSGATEYRAGPITIVIGAARGKRPGTASIDGLILHALAPPDAIAGRDVTLAHPAQPQVHVSRTDDLGSFAFDDVAAGTYTLEVSLTDEIVVVEDVHVGS